MLWRRRWRSGRASFGDPERVRRLGDAAEYCGRPAFITDLHTVVRPDRRPQRARSIARPDQAARGTNHVAAFLLDQNLTTAGFPQFRSPPQKTEDRFLQGFRRW